MKSEVKNGEGSGQNPLSSLSPCDASASHFSLFSPCSTLFPFPDPMPQFDFPLDGVLRHRRHVEEQCQRATWQACSSRCALAEDELRARSSACRPA